MTTKNYPSGVKATSGRISYKQDPGHIVQLPRTKEGVLKELLRLGDWCDMLPNNDQCAREYDRFYLAVEQYAPAETVAAMHELNDALAQRQLCKENPDDEGCDHHVLDSDFQFDWEIVIEKARNASHL